MTTEGGPRRAIGRLGGERARHLLFLSALVLIVSAMGWLVSANHALEALRVRLLPAQAPGDAVVVAIDAASLQQDRDWPWSRDRYATLVDALSEAGARRVLFDIDFSTPRAGDAAFAEAIERAGMPAYATIFRTELSGLPGVYAEMMPPPPLTDVLRPVVTRYQVDPDGYVRRYESAVEFSIGRVPALPLALSGARLEGATVPLDLTGGPQSVPVLSFAAVVSGQFPPEAVEGRTVLVGATAAELGDEFAIPGHGVNSGVLINAIAYEAAARGDFLWTAPQWLGLLACLPVGLLAFCVRPSERRGARRFVLFHAALFLAVFSMGLAARASGWVVPLAEAHLMQLGVFAVTALGAFDAALQRAFRARAAREENAALLASILERNEEGVAVIDERGIVVQSNERVDALFGMRVGGREIAGVSSELAATLEGRETGARLVLGEGEDARTIDVRWSHVTLQREASMYERRTSLRRKTVVLMHDVTPLVRAQEVERLARQQHEAASSAKSTLIATMSHELRTPLNAIIGFSDLIRDEAFGPHAAKEYAEFAGMASDGGRQLLSVVGDMLQAARFQSGDVTASPIVLTVPDVKDAVMAALPEKLAERSGAVRWADSDERLRLDPELTTLALRHLVQNALLFGGADVSVEVRLEVEGGTARFVVSDDGPGLPDDTDAQGLTGLFVQGDGSLSRAHDGCGLGLYLAEGVARAHGGEMRLDGREGFRVELAFDDAVAAVCAERRAA